MVVLEVGEPGDFPAHKSIIYLPSELTQLFAKARELLLIKQSEKITVAVSVVCQFQHNTEPQIFRGPVSGRITGFAYFLL